MKKQIFSSTLIILFMLLSFMFSAAAQSVINETNTYNFLANSNSITFRGVNRSFWTFPGTGLVLNGTNINVDPTYISNIVNSTTISNTHYAEIAGLATNANHASESDFAQYLRGGQGWNPTNLLVYYNNHLYRWGVGVISLVDDVQVSYANTAGSATPSGTAGGDLSGTYPNPSIKSDTIINSDVKTDAAIEGTKINIGNTSTRGTLQLATSGESSSTKATAANDSRLSDPRTPTNAAGGDLSGTYPNPEVVNDSHTHVNLKFNTGLSQLLWNYPTSIHESNLSALNAIGKFYWAIGWDVGTSNFRLYTTPTAIGGIPQAVEIGSLVVKAFSIKHPMKALSDKKVLVHSCIEGPQVDLIYRGVIKLYNGKATVNIDKVSNMSEGTFAALTQNRQFFLQNKDGWDPVIGQIIGNELTILSKNVTSNDEISWMVVAERRDDTINSDPRVKNGHLQTEFDQVPGPESDNVMKTQDHVYYKVK